MTIARLHCLKVETMNNIPEYIPDQHHELHDEWHAVYTVQLGELIESGLFNWDAEVLNWKEAAYNDEQYERVCEYFKQRFYYREISMIPYLEWATYLKRKLVFELMPKFKLLYERVDEGFNPLQLSDEYYKNRTIMSDYPETLLSDNSDYLSDGKDEEHEKLIEGNPTDMISNFVENFKTIDELLLNELDSLFIGMYTLNINTGW